MNYRLKRLKPYWAEFYKQGKIVAVSFRTTHKTWLVFDKRKPRKFLSCLGEHESVEDALDIFIQYDEILTKVRRNARLRRQELRRSRLPKEL